VTDLENENVERIGILKAQRNWPFVISNRTE